VIDVKNSNNSDELILVIESSKFDTENLLGYLKLKLVDYMIPKKVFFIESLPHNNNGKIDRNELRNLVRI
jgi:acyl-CoA synthetase (AMP-forming)/AMP-acid ligase II